MPINKGQSGSKEAQHATEATYAEWMQALLSDFSGEIPKLAKALHDVLKTKELRKPTDLKNLTNTIRHWYGDRRSAPAIEDELTSSALIHLVKERQIAQPKNAKGTSFEDALIELQLFRSKNKIAGKASEADAARLFEQNVLRHPVVSVKNFSLDSIDQQSALFDNQVPEYSGRELDDEVLRRFDNNFVPYVILAGPPKAGKTRTALELVKRSKLKSRDLYWLNPLPGSAQMFLDSVPVSNRSSSVIFIDDLQNFDFDPVNGLTVARFKELSSRGKVVATIHESSLTSFLNRSNQRTATSSRTAQSTTALVKKTNSEIQKTVFDIEDSILFLERNLSRSEYDDMSPLLKEILDLQKFDDGFPFAATLASVDQLASKSVDILKREDISTAVFKAAIDCYMAFYGGATDEFILELSERHYGRIRQNSRWRLDKALDAFDELTEGVVAGSDKAILQVEKPQREKYEIFDGLWEHIKPDPAKWSPDLLLEMLDNDQASDLANISFDLGYTNQAKQILEKLIQEGFEPAMSNLADLLWSEGDLDTAKETYLKAANAGNLYAQNRLGLIAEENDGDIELANSWYLKAAEAGLGWAQYNLADNLEDIGKSQDAMHWYTKAAEQGLVKAQNRLGVIAGASGNSELANSWYLKAAEAGFDWAQYNLADNLRISGLFQNAMDWYTKAADQGLVQAQTQLGLIADDAGDIELANSWYLKAAEAGFNWAQYNLGVNLRIAGDISGATHWLEKAAELGLADAQNQLGLIAEEDHGDIELANSWYLKAAEAGFNSAQYNLADNLEDAEDMKGAMHWYTQAAEQGLAEAQNRLGVLAGASGDTELATSWYQKAAEAGDGWAQCNLAGYLEDSGDIKGAIHWYTKSAEQGLSDAQNWLGILLERAGEIDLAVSWYLKAAEAGHDWAQYNLADTFQILGETQNAISWFTKAADQGISEAKERLEAIAKNVELEKNDNAAELPTKKSVDFERTHSITVEASKSSKGTKRHELPEPNKRSRLK
jgi:TPR repeat protein